MRLLRFPGLLLAAGLLCACAEDELQVGVYKKGAVVEIDADSPVTVSERASVAEAVAAAKRRAIEDLFDLFMSSQTASRDKARIESNVLSRADELVSRYRIVSSQVSGGVLHERLHAMVSYEQLSKDLEGLGLVRPAGVAGNPRVSVSLQESGPGTSGGEGPAAAAMRRALVDSGYTAVDSSSGQAAGFPSEVLVTGSAQADPEDDPRLQGYAPYRARLAFKAVAVSSAGVIAEYVQEATAVDVSSAGAAEKSLSDAGTLAAGRLKEALARRYRQRTEMSVLFTGLGGLEKARRLIIALRSQPEVVAAALDSVSGSDVKLRVFVENPSVDELAAGLMKLRGYSFNVRMVEQDYHYLEMEAGSGAF